MIGNSPNQKQKHLFLPNLAEFINPRHQLCLLAEKIDWLEAGNTIRSAVCKSWKPSKTDSLDGGVIDFETGLQFSG